MYGYFRLFLVSIINNVWVGKTFEHCYIAAIGKGKLKYANEGEKCTRVSGMKNLLDVLLITIFFYAKINTENVGISLSYLYILLNN